MFDNPTNKIPGMTSWLLLALALLLSACQKYEWQDYSPEDGKYSIQMPGKPVNKSSSQQTPAGKVTTHIAIYSDQNSAFAVSYTEYPAVLMIQMPNEKVLDGARDGRLAMGGHKLLKETHIQLMDTYPGRELQIAVAEDGGKNAIRTRIFMVNNRLYQIVAIQPKDKLFSPDAVRFMDSFTIR